MNGDNNNNQFNNAPSATAQDGQYIPPATWAGQPAVMQPKRSGKQKAIIGIISALGSVLIIGLGALAVVHFGLVNACELQLQAYDQQRRQLAQLVDSGKDLADITTDDVLDEDEELVANFQSSYKQAKELANGEQSADQCASSQRNEVLRKTIDNLTSLLAQMSQLAGDINSNGTQVKAANDAKLLSDAKSALRSTILSAQTLGNNQSLSASTRTQLNQAVASAQDILESGSYSNIVSARKQMDDIIDQVNEAISSTSAALLEIEAKVSAVVSEADSNGSYVASGVKIINTAGLQEVWGLRSMSGSCSITDEQASSWLAAFCSATPNMIYISDSLSGDTLNDIYFADAMRHEVAHYLIYRRCGTSSPSSIGSEANAESTASSYAVLYLGANANTLNRASDSRYYMNQASDEAAARIHAGQCS